PQRQVGCADRLALGDPARQRRADPALVESAADRRQSRRIRLHAERRRDGADRLAQAARRPHRRSGRPGAGLGLSSLGRSRVDIDLAAPGFDRITGESPPLDQIAHGLTFGEGPVWDRRKKRFLWTDIIGDTIYAWTPGVGTSALVHPSSHANGMTF